MFFLSVFSTFVPACVCVHIYAILRDIKRESDTDRQIDSIIPQTGARCSSVVRVFAHAAMGRRIDPSWGEPIELFLIPASAPRLV